MSVDVDDDAHDSDDGLYPGDIASVLVTEEQLRPIEVGLRYFLEAEGPRPHLLMAASTFATVPVLALFFLTQRTFIEGVSAGVKG